MTRLVAPGKILSVVKLKDLIAQKRVVESEIAERQEELRAIEVLINRQRQREGLPPDTVVLTNPPYATDNNGTHKRIRGTLKAAKQAVTVLSATNPSFTRSDLFGKVEDLNPGLAGKISPEVQRSTMRTLVKESYIVPTENVSEISGEALYRIVN